MKLKEYDVFISDCEKGWCNRNTIKSKRCNLDSKRDDCYKKYQTKTKKDNKKMNTVDEEWEKVRHAVWYRDAGFFFSGTKEIKEWKKYCRVWKCLTDEEKRIVESKYSADLWLNKTLDPAHRYFRNVRPEEKYNVNNIFLISRMFHSLLDEMRNPVTREHITIEEREEWFERILQSGE